MRRKDAVKIEAENMAKKRALRFREFQDGKRAAGPQNAAQLGEAAA